MSYDFETADSLYNDEFTDDEEIEDNECRGWNEQADKHQYGMGEAAENTYIPGATKGTYQANDQDSSPYHNATRVCDVTVQKLIWADGYQGGSGNSKPMTLVMLQLQFNPRDQGKITYASFKLRLKSDTPEQEDPQLVAWGPFHNPEKSNATNVHKETGRGHRIGADFGFASQKATGSSEWTKTAAWDEECAEIGRSTALFSGKMKRSQRSNSRVGPDVPNGVLWQVLQNQQLDRGISPKFRVAALFLRPTSSSYYKTSFKINARTSKAQGLLQRIGVSDGDKVKWRVRVKPCSRDRCFFEGRRFIERIELGNLDKLRETPNSQLFNEDFSDRLDLSKDILATSKAVQAKDNASSQPTDTDRFTPEKRARSATLEGEEAVTAPAALPKKSVNFAEQTEPSEAARPSAGRGREGGDSASPWSSSQPPAKITPLAAVMPNHEFPGRMAALEARVAEDEGRIGRQDARIAVLEERIARLEKTLLRMTEALLQSDRNM